MTTNMPVGSNDWDQFWKADDAPEAAASVSAQNHLTPFWTALLQRELATFEGDTLLIDLGCGTGALGNLAGELASTLALNLSVLAIDYAPSAVAVAQTAPHIDLACVADASDLPLSPKSAHLVVSQYGLEYAGIAALQEAPTFLATGGRAHLICHTAAGAIAQECGRNASAIKAIFDTKLIEVTRSVFEGMAQGTPPTNADREMVQRGSGQLGNLLRTEGRDIAGGLPQHLYQDLSGLFSRPQNYPPAEIVSWCDGMLDQMKAYHARMTAMTEAALTDDEAKDITAYWSGLGLTASATPVHDGDALIGWHLSAARA